MLEFEINLKSSFDFDSFCSKYHFFKYSILYTINNLNPDDDVLVKRYKDNKVVSEIRKGDLICRVDFAFSECKHLLADNSSNPLTVETVLAVCYAIEKFGLSNNSFDSIVDIFFKNCVQIFVKKIVANQNKLLDVSYFYLVFDDYYQIWTKKDVE